MMHMMKMLMKMTLPIMIFIIVNVLHVDSMPTCAAGQFYDEDVPGCEYCFTICQHPELTNTLAKCLRKCPGTKTSAPATTTMTPTIVHADSTNSALIHGEQIVAIVVSVIVFIAVAVAVSYKMIKRRKKTPRKHPVEAEDEGHSNSETVPGAEQHDNLIADQFQP